MIALRGSEGGSWNRAFFESDAGEPVIIKSGGRGGIVRPSSAVRRSVAAPLLWLLALSGAAACEMLAPPEPLPAAAEPAFPSSQYARWWAETENCSGLRGDMTAIAWYVVPDASSFSTEIGEKVGLWSRSTEGARVVLAGKFARNELVVRHEMLHALLGQTGHPPEYFTRRCHLTWDNWPDSGAAVTTELATRG
jgi:hypothetical protein